MPALEIHTLRSATPQFVSLPIHRETFLAIRLSDLTNEMMTIVMTGPRTLISSLAFPRGGFVFLAHDGAGD
jgi:hypothetical protein